MPGRIEARIRAVCPGRAGRIRIEPTRTHICDGINEGWISCRAAHTEGMETG